MKLASTLSLITLALAPALSSAATTGFTIDFEKNWSYGEAVDNQYAAQGVTFTNVLGVSNDPAFDPYYSNAPSPLGVAMAQLDGVTNTTAFMNVTDGVDGLLTFFYSTPNDVIGAVKAYSGLNGTGTLLGTFNLVANTADYSNWSSANFTFSGTAKSFDLSATANVAGLDNIAAVPEPTGLALAACSLAIMGVSLRRRVK